MKRQAHKEAYRAAFDEASSELRKIFGEADRLLLRRDQVAKLMEVLNRRFGFEAHVAVDHMTLKSHQPGFTAETHLAVVETKRRVGN